MAIKDWSTTASSNASSDSGIALSGTVASIRTADDSMRSIMQRTAIWVADTNGSRSTAGSSNAYTYASAGASATPSDAFTAYADGDRIKVKASFSTTGASTLNVDGVGAKAIKIIESGSESDTGADDIVSGNVYEFIYVSAANSSAGAWCVYRESAINYAASQNLSLAQKTQAQENIGVSWTYGTEQATTSGTSVSFTGIADGATEVIIIFKGVAVSTTAEFRIQIGDSGGIETSGYASRATNATSSGNTYATSTASFLAKIDALSTATHEIFCRMVLIDAATNEWSFMAVGSALSVSGDVTSAGRKSLSGTLTQLDVLTTAGNFTAGSVQIMYR